MAFNIVLRSTLNYSVENGVKMLAYGRAGRGKTTLCATCPSPVIFSAESGLLSLARFNLPYYPIESVAALRDAYAWCKGSAEARQFETVCLDSISEIAEICLASQKVKDGRMAYGDMIKEMNGVIKDFRDLAGKHVYMTAKEERSTNAAGVTLAGPSMPGKKLGEAMPYFPDQVFQADIDPVGGFYFLRCRPDYANDAKDRSGALDAMEEPHIGKIIAKIRAAVPPNP